MNNNLHDDSLAIGSEKNTIKKLEKVFAGIKKFPV